MKKDLVSTKTIKKFEDRSKIYLITPKDIKGIERIIRGSLEYKNLISYFKNTLNVNNCSFYKNWSLENGFNIEFHHHPFTLYDICETVINKYIEEQKFYEKLIVAKNVVQLHYDFKVGLVPLNPTAHGLVHDGKLSIHPDLILGGWETFVKEYRKFMNDDVLEKANAMRKLFKDKNYDEFPEIMQPEEVILYESKLQELEDFNKKNKLLLE